MKFNIVYFFIAIFLSACKNNEQNSHLQLDGAIENAEGQIIYLQYLSFTQTETLAETLVDDGKFYFEIELATPGMYALRLNSFNYWVFLLENKATKVHIDAQNPAYSHAKINTDRGATFSNVLLFLEQTLVLQDSIYADFPENGYMNQNTMNFTDSVDLFIYSIIMDRIVQEEDPVIITYLLKWMDSSLNFEFMGDQIDRLQSIAPDDNYTKELLKIYEQFASAVEQERAEKNGFIVIDSSLYQTDFDTVQIGNQVWMAENLNTPTSNSRCIYDDPVYCEAYGRLYNWYDAQLACPPGWHLPSDEEWMELEMFLGMKEEDAYLEAWRGENVGGKLKTNDSLWDQPNVGANNSSGFNAVPCGPRNKFGMYGHFGHNVIYWTASSYSDTHAFFRYLGNSRNDVGRSAVSKYTGYYVRCIKDLEE